jgi:hypothetical protein
MSTAELRTMIEAEWTAAKSVADQRGALHGSVGTTAGLYLELAGGDAQVAATIVPVAGAFWERVRGVLLEIHHYERSNRVETHPSASNVIALQQARARRANRQ